MSSSLLFLFFLFHLSQIFLLLLACFPSCSFSLPVSVLLPAVLSSVHNVSPFTPSARRLFLIHNVSHFTPRTHCLFPPSVVSPFTQFTACSLSIWYPPLHNSLLVPCQCGIPFTKHTACSLLMWYPPLHNSLLVPYKYGIPFTQLTAVTGLRDCHRQ